MLPSSKCLLCFVVRSIPIFSSNSHSSFMARAGGVDPHREYERNTSLETKGRRSINRQKMCAVGNRFYDFFHKVQRIIREGGLDNLNYAEPILRNVADRDASIKITMHMRKHGNLLDVIASRLVCEGKGGIPQLGLQTESGVPNPLLAERI
eukprot:m.138126 g.138126  ORF g.138126 m.138126 type:complete len:151 (+) comp52520_c0_seq1:628-1080(+)